MREEYLLDGKVLCGVKGEFVYLSSLFAVLNLFQISDTSLATVLKW